MGRSSLAALLVVASLVAAGCSSQEGPAGSSPTAAAPASPSPSPEPGATPAPPSPTPAGGPVHVAWAREPGQPFGSLQVFGMARIGDRLIAWGEEADGVHFMASVNGSTWTAIATPPGVEEPFSEMVTLGAAVVAPTLAGDHLAALVGGPDLDLERVESPALARLGDLRVREVDGAGQLLVCGLSADANAAHSLLCAITDDGRTWREADPPIDQLSVTGAALEQGFALLATRDGVTTTWRTLDGAAWSEVPAASEPDRLNGLRSLAALAGGLVAGGSRMEDDGSSRAAAWVSGSGSLWRQVLVTPEESLRVRRVGEIVVAVATDVYCRDGAVYASADGLTWGRSPTPVPLCPEALVALDDDELLAIAPDGETGRTAVWRGRITEGAGAAAPQAPATPAPTAAPSIAPPSGTAGDPALGMAWSSDPIDRAPGRVRDVAAWAGGVVAVGELTVDPGTGSNDPPMAWLSRDGVSWTRAAAPPGTLPDESWARVNAVAAGGPGLVAVGAAHQRGDGESRLAFWTSTDGSRWSRVPHSRLMGGLGVPIDVPEPGLYDVTAWTGGLAAVGYGDDATVWTSQDGLAWAPAASLPEAKGRFPGARWLYGIAEGASGLVAVGGSGSYPDFASIAWTSEEGATWTAAMDPPGAGMAAVLRWDDRLVAVGRGPVSAISRDGRSWTAGPGQAATRGASFDGVAGAGDRLVALGRVCRDDGCTSAAWVSADGLAWTRSPEKALAGAVLAAIAAVDGRVVAVGPRDPGPAGDAPRAWLSPP